MAYLFDRKQDAEWQKKQLESGTGKKYKIVRENGLWCVMEKTRKAKPDWDAVEKAFEEGWNF